MRKIDLTGKRFGRLVVLSKYDVVGNGETRWLCQCDCGNKPIVRRAGLKNGTTQSCGCLHSETIGKVKRKYNIYDLSYNYGIGWTTNTNKEFYFDLEDYDKIKNYCWYENDQGYILTTYNKKQIRLHRFILNILDNYEIIVDHKNLKRNDNRKENLRYANKQTNGINRPKNKNNKLGHKGITKIGNQYYARITKDYNNIEIGHFDNLDDAIKARKQKEIELFGEFAYER